MANIKIDRTRLMTLAVAAREGNAESGAELASLLEKFGKKALQETAAENPELLLFMAERAMIPMEDIDKYLVDVSWLDYPAVIETLLRYKKNPPSAQTEAAELQKAAAAADPKNDWMTEKLPDGTLKLVSYKGEEKDIVVPAKLGKATVSTIGAFAFTPKKPRLKKDLSVLRAQIRSVEIPEGITTIEGDPGDKQWGWIYIGMFEGCDKLKKVQLPNSVKDIPRGMFLRSGISEIVLPESLETIGEKAFGECVKLRSITMPSHIKELGQNLFTQSMLEEFYWPENDGTTTLPSYMFSWCRNLRRIELPKNLTVIDSSAFTGCVELEELHIPEGVRAIKDGTFYGCKKLKRLYLPASVESIDPGKREQYLDSRTFANCEKLVIYAPAGSYAETFSRKNNIPFVAV